ncbi:hypothetical protein L7F22_001414 [Adiantum nelumboides]|nr:hypothetical protein [Adiantum nelumboides]
MGVVPEPSPSKNAVVIGERKKKAPKLSEPSPSKTVQGLKIATPQGQDAPLSADVPRESCQGATSKKVPKVPKEGLKIATSQSQDARLSTDVPQEPCQGANLKKVPKEAQPTKQGLKIAMPAKMLLYCREPCQDAILKKAPNKAQPTKQGLNLVKGLGTLKAQKSGQSKEVNGTAGTQPGAPKEDQQTKQVGLCPGLSVGARVLIRPLEGSKEWSSEGGERHNRLRATQDTGMPLLLPGFILLCHRMNKRKTKADVKEKEGMAVPEQHNVKRLKRMKEVGVREVAFEQKLAIDEVKGHTSNGQLEKVPENKIALKRDGMKKKAKKHVEKGLEDKGPANKAPALVGSSKRPKLQVKRAKQLGASCIASTTTTSKTSNEKPYVEVINGDKLVSICRAKPPFASRNTLMEKRSRMMQHLKKVHGLDVFIPQRLGGRPRGSVSNDMPKSSIRDQAQAQQRFKDVNQKFSVNRRRIEERAKHRAALTWDVLPRKAQKAMKKNTFIMEFVVNHMKMVDQKEEAMKKEIKGCVEEGYESRGARDCSDGDDIDDDGSGGGDDKADCEDDGTDDEDDSSGSDEGNSEGVNEQDDAQDVSTDEDEVQEILSSPASILA